MSDQTTVRSWKDRSFRESLSGAETRSIEPHPAGAYELDELELAEIVGASTEKNMSYGCCSGNNTSNCGTCGGGTSGCCGS
ncbi:mersacidin/lichenicidin family type 2 lantibiotic [Granulicella aggregans]|uniref:mersacidin/lichenicidin family type 2 lantibiotic n=1 Tax=Granulicella aggregans TaxID=474949 RepID=UPI003D7C2F02